MEDSAYARDAPVGACIVVSSAGCVNPHMSTKVAGLRGIQARASNSTRYHGESSLVRIASCPSAFGCACALRPAPCSSSPLVPRTPHWQLDDLQGHLPDPNFQMTNDLGQPVTAASYRGKVVLLYFGYTHCPDVCPLTLVHLHTVLQKLGKDAD